MKKVIAYMISGVFFSLLLYACSKTDNDISTPEETKLGTGTIYYDWATDGLLKINLENGVRSTVLPGNNSRYSIDISKDGAKILTASHADDQDYDANVYTYMSIANGNIIAKFKYYPTDGDLTSPLISPDEKMIAVPPTYEDGIVILNMEGKILHHLSAFAEKKITGQILWMPDNTLLFRMDNTIYRTNTTFTQANLIKQLTFNEWSDMEVNPDGTKIAFRGGNHIWMMQSDGSDLKQITISDNQENYPVFSPDGKYLLIGANYHSTGPFGHLWYLTIIPADGQQYNVNEGADQRVVSVIANGESRPEASDGGMFWR